MVDMVQSEFSRQQLQAEINRADANNVCLVQERSFAQIRERNEQERLYRLRSKLQDSKPLSSSKDERALIVEQERASLIGRNVEIRCLQVEEEGLQRARLLDQQQNDLMNPASGIFATNAITSIPSYGDINSQNVIHTGSLATRGSDTLMGDIQGPMPGREKLFGPSPGGLQRRGSYILYLLPVVFQFLFP